MNNYSKALELFVADWNGNLSKPIIRNGIAMATNSHALIFFDENKLGDEHPYVNNEKFPDTTRFLEYKKNCNSLISAEAIAKLLEKQEKVKVYETITCDECDGEVEWSYSTYTKDADCPKCDGHGEIRTGKYSWEHSRFLYLKIGNSHFIYNHFEPLLKVSELFGSPLFIVNQTTESKESYFIVGGITIALMPQIYKDSDDDENYLGEIHI